MAYNNYNPVSEQQSPTFNADLFHRQSTLECLIEYIRFKQLKDFDNMFEMLESVVDHNIAMIDAKDIDPLLMWLRKNKAHWCVKDQETGQIVRVNNENRERIELMFQKCHRTVMKELFAKGIIHKIKDSPGHTMRHFES